MKRKPIAILISDIHYNITNLSLAEASMRQAISKAKQLDVPLIVAGDLHDQKANLRGECVKAMMDTFEHAGNELFHLPIVLRGNHDAINEKGEAHSLECLRLYADIISTYVEYKGFHFIPYQHDPKEFERILAGIPKGSLVIGHQGVYEADSGEYVHDKSAISSEILADYRVIMGHYHKAQDIKCGRPQKGAVGLMSYIGTPYSISFAEANDGPKGFQILYSDGLMEQVPTNLRKHIILETYTSELRYDFGLDINPGDLLWVKVKGPTLELEALSKDNIMKALSLDNKNFKLDKIPTDTTSLLDKDLEKLDNGQIMDKIIDTSDESAAKKAELKALWRSL